MVGKVFLDGLMYDGQKVVLEFDVFNEVTAGYGIDKVVIEDTDSGKRFYVRQGKIGIYKFVEKFEYVGTDDMNQVWLIIYL